MGHVFRKLYTDESAGDSEMTLEGVKIRYGDVAPEAKENFTPTVTDKADFVDLSQLQKYNMDFPNFGNPCEYGSVLLDSSAEPFPSYPESENMGLWSNRISGADGTFETPITLTLTAEGQYSSQGFTLTFDTYNNIFCNDLTVTWYRADTQLETADFTPNSAFYFCRKKVENFDKVVMVFKKLNMPYNRLKLRVIDYGYGTFFKGAELRNVNVIQELDPISAELSIDTVDFTLDSKTDMEYSFQSKQPLSVYFNGQLRATTFVSRSTRQSKNVWRIESEDYIGQLTRLTFLGDIYTEKNAKELLESIFSQAKVPVEIADSLAEKTVTGHIPVCDCREAVRQICYAIGAVVSTANSDTVKIFEPSNDVTQVIPLTRIRQGQSFDEDDRVTAVRVVSHSYAKSEESTEVYNAEKSGTGDEILVQFSEPFHDLSITNGEILKNEDNTLKSSANYAIIKANTGCVLTGKKYVDTTAAYTRQNPIVSASDLENIVEVTDATLVNPANVSDVLEKTYNNAIKRTTTQLKINEGYDHVKWGDGKWGAFKWSGKRFDTVIEPGDVVTSETEYLGNVTGRIVSERYNCNGYILVKECELK